MLLSRGLKDCYVHFSDDKTRNFVDSRIDHLALQFAAEQEANYNGGQG